MLKKDGYIPLSENSSIEPRGLLENFRDVIFNDDIHNRDDFYEILHTHATNFVPGLVSLLEKWEEENPELYLELLTCVPDLVTTLELKYTYHEIEQHRKVLKKSIEELTLALENKLK